MLPSSDASRPSSDDSNPRNGRAAVDPVVEGGWLERRVAPLAERFGNAPAVLALREALPVAFVGLLAALVGLVAFAETGKLVDRLRAAIPGAFAAMSVLLVVILAIRLARRLAIPTLPLLLASLAVFGFALPPGALASFAAFARLVGSAGLFTAIVSALLAAGAIVWSRRRVPGIAGVLLGAAAVVAAAGALAAAHVSIGLLLGGALAPLADLGDSFTALLLITAIEAALWTVGIHGPALLAAIVLPVYLNFQFANTQAFANHEPLPHKVVVSTFLFVFPGGAGATLPLVALLMRSRVPRLRTFGFATILPSLINTNEPVLFGLPLVYNPILAIPFVLAPVALVMTTYAALTLHLVRWPVYYVPSTIPLFLNVFLATFDWRAVVLAAVNLLVAGAIYLPFVRIYERSEIARQRRES